ncbi:hypothetical protein RND81_07G196300 [Saponaria officinalis]|uniref:Peptidase A2 domain-containing protein n=1 Tax=Saponaria officinalis TaxID=3572 RepID=A0AAW1JSV1_SAPOF
MHLQTTEDVASAIAGKTQEGESSKSYKEALKEESQYPRLVQSLKHLRKGMCFVCADLLHFELIRMQAIPNDPGWVPAHQRRFTRFTKRGREVELAGMNRGLRGSRNSGPLRQPLEPASAKAVNQSKTQQKKIAKQVSMAARSRFDQKLQHEVMIADMRVKEQKHQDKGKELVKEGQAPVSCDKGSLKIPESDLKCKGRTESSKNKELNECTDALGKLNDIDEGDYEDDMEGISGDDLDLIVTDEDLKDPDIQFGSLDKETLECMVATLPEEFSAQSTLVKGYSQPSGMLECLSISKPARSAGKDRELTDTEKDVLVKALFTPRGVDNQHSKALYLKVRLEGKTVSKVLVDNGATSNIVPITILQLIGKTEDDITPGKVTVVGFAGTPEFCEGTIMLIVKVGSCTLTMPFYVVRGITSYNALLGRSWLHKTYCIPSSFHQLLVMWNGRRYEIIYADMPSVEINFSVVHDRCSKGSAALRIEESDMPRGGDTNKGSKSLLEKLKIEELIEVEDLEVEELTLKTKD